MNLTNSSFLCLDIGTYAVYGIGNIIKEARIIKSFQYSVKSKDTVFAIKSVVDEIEKQLKTHFDSAFVTANFGEAKYIRHTQETHWNTEHLINPTDLHSQISKIKTPEDFYALHIIPMVYGTPTQPHMKINNLPINHIDTSLKSVFGVICYEWARTNAIKEIMRKAHIKPIGFMDSCFLQNEVFRTKNEKNIFIDLGAGWTTVSLWGNRGPLFFKKIKFGQDDITQIIAEKSNLSIAEADNLKISFGDAISDINDAYTPIAVGTEYFGLNRDCITNVMNEKLLWLISTIKNDIQQCIEQYKPTKIILSGGGAAINNIEIILEDVFHLPIEKKNNFASVEALSKYIWESQLPERNNYLQKNYFNFESIFKIFHRKKATKPITKIMPSSLCFNMRDFSTYMLFNSANLGVIHIDIMDGFYVNRVAGSIKELAEIRTKTNAHLHVHLMTESPTIWATDALNAGADTVIISTNTVGVKDALKTIKTNGKRCGIALNPETSVNILKPIIKDIDEIMIMAVKPGAAGQQFDNQVLKKISILDKTRKKYKLHFVISVDGGINPDTAKLCWKAGADALVSGSYLSSATDFPLAVQNLLNH